MYEYHDEKKQHLHTLDGKPLFGTSTITKIIAKPLTWWAAGCAVAVMGWLNPKNESPEDCQQSAFNVLEQIKQMDVSQYLALLNKAYRAHNETLSSKAKSGTDMHAELERYVKRCIVLQNGEPMLSEVLDPKFVSDFANWSILNVKRFLWSEMNCYSSTLWVGGITDAGAELLDGRTVVVDFKSSKEAYFDQFVQCAGYDLQISENGGYDEQGNKTFTLQNSIDGYCIIPFGLPEFGVRFVYDVTAYREAFKAAATLHKLSESY